MTTTEIVRDLQGTSFADSQTTQTHEGCGFPTSVRVNEMGLQITCDLEDIAATQATLSEMGICYRMGYRVRKGVFLSAILHIADDGVPEWDVSWDGERWVQGAYRPGPIERLVELLGDRK